MGWCALGGFLRGLGIHALLSPSTWKLTATSRLSMSLSRVLLTTLHQIDVPASQPSASGTQMQNGATQRTATPARRSAGTGGPPTPQKPKPSELSIDELLDPANFETNPAESTPEPEASGRKKRCGTKEVYNLIDVDQEGDVEHSDDEY